LKANHPCLLKWLWHAVWQKFFDQRTPTTMKTTIQPYLRLKREAMRQMLTGDVERYMRTLRLLNDLRGRSRAIA